MPTKSHYLISLFGITCENTHANGFNVIEYIKINDLRFCKEISSQQRGLRTGIFLFLHQKKVYLFIRFVKPLTFPRVLTE